jgi:hypothetical protein
MKMTRSMLKLALVLLISVGANASAQDAGAGNQATLADFPFWQKMSGWWASDNTYLDSDMNYLIRSYNSLVHIELDGRNFRETEIRIYPAGLGTSRYGKGLEKPGEGIEIVVTTTGELIDDSGSLGKIFMDHSASSSGPNVVYRMLGENDGVRLNTNPKTGVDTYRMYFNFVTSERRLRSNVGLYSEGEDMGGLRAFILYRDRRISSSAFETRRAALRKTHNVKMLSVADPDNPGQSLVTRLD